MAQLGPFAYFSDYILWTKGQRDCGRQFQKLDEVRKEHVLEEGHCSDEIDDKCSLNQVYNMLRTIITNNYLIGEGIDLNTAYNNFTIEETELSNNNYIVVLLLSISIVYIILSICISTSNMAIQTTATEKENGTLETILTFPINKTELILGKYLSAVIVGFTSALCSLIFMIVSLYIGKHQYNIFESIEISLSITTILGSSFSPLAFFNLL